MISWIGVDWGTTNLRAFAIDDNGLAMEEKGVVRQSLTRIKVPRSHKSMKRRFETTQ